jgi:hypothetical protein
MDDESNLKIDKIEVIKPRKFTWKDQYEALRVKMNADDYYSDHMVEYKQPESYGWSSIKVLEFLNGKPWDNVALAYVHSLRPSSIRVTTGCITLDSRIWRVTVFVDDDNIIKYITQEVEVGLPDGVANGEALDDALNFGIDSEQVKWHLNSGGYFHDGINGGYYKVTDKGTIPYPKPTAKPKPITDTDRLDFILNGMEITDIDYYENDAIMLFKQYIPYSDKLNDKKDLIDWLIKDANHDF